MKIVVVADIHGNLPALEAVISHAPTPDILLCAGDISGYFPSVNEVIEILDGSHAVCVLGNHDAVLLNPQLTTGSFSADHVLRSQRASLAPQSRGFLGMLPISQEISLEKKIRLFHGTPSDSLMGREPFWNSPLAPGVYVCGHTHIPLIHVDHAAGVIVVNPGGTGFPRDGDPRAGYAVIDTYNWDVTIHRVEYDLGRVVRSCKSAGLSANIIASLESGRWVSRAAP